MLATRTHTVAQIERGQNMKHLGKQELISEIDLAQLWQMVVLPHLDRDFSNYDASGLSGLEFRDMGW